MHRNTGHSALYVGMMPADPGVVERFIATYSIDGHEVDVVEMLDDDGAWFELAIDGAILPDGGSFTAVPSEAVITDVLHRCHATAA